MTNLLRNSLRALIVLLALTGVAQAHPHVWVTFKSELLYAPDGALTGIRHSWAFDDMFSAFATQGIAHKGEGFTREELAPLAETNVTSLKEFGYFTFVTADGKKIDLTDPPKNEYWLGLKDGVLTLYFTLPLKQPVKANKLDIEVYDPSVFIDFEFAKDDDAIKFVHKPAGCGGTYETPREMTFQEQKALAQIPADQQNTTMAWGAQFANKIKVTCK
jgi:ABC-type uncharacterized transport system substrate-binding protein